MLGEISFLNFFFVISIIVIVRYEILNLLFQFSNQSELFQQTVFRSLSFFAIISFYALFFFSIYFYRFIENNDLLLFIIFFVICSVYFSHLSIYLRIVRINPQNLVYLILYLCAFKIAPWLWLYKAIF